MSCRMLLTGYVMLFGWYGGFVGAGWHIHTMHLTALLMTGVFVASSPDRGGFRAALGGGDRAAAAPQWTGSGSW